MKKLVIVFKLVFLSQFCAGQTQDEIDSLINTMCLTINTTKYLDDSTRIQNTFSTHLYPFLSKYPENIREELWTKVFIRCQRSCLGFLEILERDNPSHEDWQKFDKKPKSNIEYETCENFLDIENFWYHEPNGDTVRLIIKNGFWTDHFEDGTYSHLKFYWTYNCQFEIEFIESNNIVRRNFSVPGDRYQYELLSKHENYYYVIVKTPEHDSYIKFKLYFNQ